MSIRGFEPRFQIRQGSTGSVVGAKVSVTVEDADLRKQPGQESYDGLEKVFVELKRKDGTLERVEVPYRKSEDPAPGMALTDPPFNPAAGPHGNRGPVFVSVESGRTVDRYELLIDADKYDINYGVQVKFILETNKGGHFEEQANPETLWK